MIRSVLGSVKAMSSAFLVEHRRVLTVVDTGVHGCARRILATLRKGGWKPEAVDQIVLTHCHGDHSGEAKRLKEETGAVLVVGAEDAVVVEGSAPYPSPPGRLFQAMYRNLERFPRVSVERRVDGREELEGGLVAVPAPGHTRGHIAVFAPDLSALFVGDAVWRLGPVRPSWRALTADPAQNTESVKELSSLRADRVLLGHGPSISGDRLRELAASL